MTRFKWHSPIATIRVLLRYYEWSVPGVALLAAATTMVVWAWQFTLGQLPPRWQDTATFASAQQWVAALAVVTLLATFLWRRHRLFWWGCMAARYHQRSCNALWDTSSLLRPADKEGRRRLYARADLLERKAQELAARVTTY